MERKRRTYIHKSKIRFKRRLPRKRKKILKKIRDKKYTDYKERLIKMYGEDKWIENWIIGG